jgi:hypothetical protein
MAISYVLHLLRVMIVHVGSSRYRLLLTLFSMHLNRMFYVERK